MEYRRLGRSGLQVSEIALGTWQTFGMRIDDETAAECVRTAWDLGINFFDTADAYVRGAAETALGKALAGLPRDTYVLATKCCGRMGDAPNQRGLSRKHIHEAIDASLTRLGVDYVDLYQAHRYDDQTPLDETLRAFDDLVRAGKVRYVGTSNWTAEQIMDAHRLAECMNLDRTVSNQPVYSMFRRDIEREIVPTCRKLGVGQVVYSPLAQGALTGKYAKGQVPPDSRAAAAKPSASIHQYLTDERLERIDKLKAIAAELEVTMAGLALAWCLRLDNLSSVICGATRPAQIEQNAAAAGRKIPDDALHRIEQILS